MSQVGFLACRGEDKESGLHQEECGKGHRTGQGQELDSDEVSLQPDPQGSSGIWIPLQCLSCWDTVIACHQEVFAQGVLEGRYPLGHGQFSGAVANCEPLLINTCRSWGVGTLAWKMGSGQATTCIHYLLCLKFSLTVCELLFTHFHCQIVFYCTNIACAANDHLGCFQICLLRTMLLWLFLSCIVSDT